MCEECDNNILEPFIKDGCYDTMFTSNDDNNNNLCTHGLFTIYLNNNIIGYSRYYLILIQYQFAQIHRM